MSRVCREFVAVWIPSYQHTIAMQEEDEQLCFSDITVYYTDNNLTIQNSNFTMHSDIASACDS